MVSAGRQATYQDVLDAPEDMVAELINGKLNLQPRPAKRHARVASILGMVLGPPYHLGDGGPGGWEILDEPEIHFGADVIVPDLAGWRSAVTDPYEGLQTYFTAVPQWVCEVLSKSTAKKDREQKVPLYGRAGVEHVWLLDPTRSRLEVLVLRGGELQPLQAHEGEAVFSAPPFEAVAIRGSQLWR